MAGISLRNICKSYGPAPILRDISLDVEDGEFLTLLGPSGCGKSTLLRIIAGLEAQGSGSVAIAGRPVDGMRPKSRDVAMVFQSYALYPHMTAAENMALPLRMRRLSALRRLPLLGRWLPGTRATLAAIDAEVQHTAALLEIGAMLHRKPGRLSGGQRQRVAIGRAMVRRPAVFLMDEPLSNLDAKLRVTMRAEIKALHQRVGGTFVYVTHDQAEAMTMSDRVAVMRDGVLLQVAPPAAIYDDPADRAVAEFVGSPRINLLDATLRERGIAELAGSALPVPPVAAPGTPVTIGIRPESFRQLDRAGAGILSGRIRLIQHLGSDLFVHLDMPGAAEPMIARLPAEHASRLRIGEALHLAVPPERILLFDRQGGRLRAPGASVTLLRSFA